MGLLKVGVPKTWEESKSDLKYIRKAGVRQFIRTYQRVKDLKGDELLWGDEIEYGIFQVDSGAKKVRLSVRAKEIMDELNKKESEHFQVVEGCNWVPEYGAWMVEATPNRPYTGYTTDLLRVERNMRLRRTRLLAVLRDDEAAPTLSAPLMLGAQGDDGAVPAVTVGGPLAESRYVGDGIINPHPRFGTLTANIRQRRGSKVCVSVPLFRDANTPEYNDDSSAAQLAGGGAGGAAAAGGDGCCGGDAQQLWRYGKGDACTERHGFGRVIVGCTKTTTDEEFDDRAVERGAVMQKWLVDVKCAGCKGLFYRSKPGVIVPDADWPRNGEVVIGHELQEHPGWIRLQNGYYLPVRSDKGDIPFLHKVSQRVTTGADVPSTVNSSNNKNVMNGQQSSSSSSSSETKRLGSDTPLFRQAAAAGGGAGEQPVTTTSMAALLSGGGDDNSKNGVQFATGTSTATATSTLPSETTEAQETVVVAAAAAAATKEDNNVRAAIHMDAMAFGMGCCCLQITFQCKDVDESRFLYDQLAVMAPIMMALTASTPVVKGRLADTDARWGIISESVDCRTPAERGRSDPGAPHESLNAAGQRRIYKSRYDSISAYIYQGRQQEEVGGAASNRVCNLYNDIPVPVDEESYELLRKAGVDPALAQHVAHLFIRDPLVVFEGAVEEVDDDTQTEHWESIQSTNWQTVRWKPPPPRNSPNDPHIGWRTEFRSMEIQLTDFENAAFSVFAVLLTRVILTFDLNLYIPLSRVDANMQRAHSRLASARGKFFFRRHMAPLEEGDDGYGVKYDSMFKRAVNGGGGGAVSDGGGGGGGTRSSTKSSEDSNNNNNKNRNKNNADDGGMIDGVSQHRRMAPCAPGSDEENSYEEMTMMEIMCGKGDYFPGLIPLIQAYLDYIGCDSITRQRLNEYMAFIAKRAAGELVTPATYIRNLVRNHPAYGQDSVVTDEIAADVTSVCADIGLGRRHAAELTGSIKIRPINVERAYEVKLDSTRAAQNDALVNLLRRYTRRGSFSDSHVRRSSISE